jgi:hypothetical protein
MENRQITIDDLLRKIGAMTVQLDIAEGNVKLLQEEIEKLRSLSEQKADAKTIAK